MKRKLTAFFLVLFLIGTLASCGLSVPRPEIKEAEFDFSVTYELNGETKSVSGVYVCEFDGVSWVLDGGYGRDWKGYIKDGSLEMNTVIGTTEDGGKIVLDFGLHPTYFMSDPYSEALEDPKPTLIINYSNDATGEESWIADEEAIAEYGAKIISYDYDAPIQNNFK